MLSAAPIVLRIGLCAFADARPLLAQHYAIGLPARVCCTLGARIDGDLVGVLTVSHPTLNDRWRALAWPGVFDTCDKRERARLLNEQIRRISRVVVRARFRGMGIATALVRAYLRRPLTSKTEVVAAMGEFCSCFEQAGMRAVECAPIERDVALATALKRMRIPPELLADERVVQRLARDASFVKAMRAWANAAGATRKVLRRAEAIEELAPIAARAVVLIHQPARVWVWEASADCGITSTPSGCGGLGAFSGRVARGLAPHPATDRQSFGLKGGCAGAAVV